MGDSKTDSTVQAEKKENEDASIVKEKQYYPDAPIPQGTKMMHGSIHKDIVPQGAIRMTENEVLTMVRKTMSEWRPRMEM